MASINRVYAARLARMQVLGPMGESLGRVRDVVVSISIVRQQPRVLGLVVEMASRRRIFVPMLRVAAIEPNGGWLDVVNDAGCRTETGLASAAHHVVGPSNSSSAEIQFRREDDVRKAQSSLAPS